MAITVSLLGVNYSIPETSDAGYDVALTTYLKALATAFPQLNGGTQSLTAELDFGTSFGLKAAWYKSETTNPASAGQVRLAKTDTIKYRNNANSADLALAIDTADALTWNGANVTGNPMLDASTAAGQSIPTGGTDTIVVFGTVARDSDSAYNSGTGRYTVPTGKGGDYSIVGMVAYNTAPGGSCAVTIYKNAVIVKNAVYSAPGAQTTMLITAILNVAAGDVIDIRTHHGNAGSQNLWAAATANYFQIKRIAT